jgi:hypothetical protein
VRRFNNIFVEYDGFFNIKIPTPLIAISAILKYIKKSKVFSLPKRIHAGKLPCQNGSRTYLLTYETKFHKVDLKK